MNTFHRVKEASVALQELAYDSGVPYNTLAEFWNCMVNCGYSYEESVDILELVFKKKGERSNES